MIWGDRPVDTTATQQLPRLSGTIPNQVVTDEVLAGRPPTETLAFADAYDDSGQPVKRRAAHRRPPRMALTGRGTVAAASVVGAGVFVAVLMFSGHHSPDPASVRQAAPEVSVEAPSPKPTVKPKRAPERRAEPVVLRSERPAPRPVVTVTVKVTPTPKPSTPRPTKPVTPSPTPSATPVIPVTTDPEPTTPDASDEAETNEPETAAGDRRGSL